MPSLHAALLQIPGLAQPDLSFSEQVRQMWVDTGFMRWPLALCLVRFEIPLAHQPDSLLQLLKFAAVLGAESLLRLVKFLRD